MKAAKCSARLSSRAGAAEVLCISEEAVKDAELGRYKNMPVENALRMAEVYHAPELRNHYCLNECPIGKTLPLSSEAVSPELAAVKLLRTMKMEEISRFLDTLLDITAGGTGVGGRIGWIGRRRC